MLIDILCYFGAITNIESKETHTCAAQCDFTMTAKHNMLLPVDDIHGYPLHIVVKRFE